MSMTAELTGVRKNANLHRLSRLIAYAPNDELRQIAVEVEHYTEQLVEALEAKEQQRANWFQMAQKLGEDLDAAEKRIAELEREKETLRPVGVMSLKAFNRLENRGARFIALWPRPGIYLPRKRPEDGVIVYARTVVGVALECE